MNSELVPSKILLVCLGFNAKMRTTKQIGVDLLENMFNRYGQLSKILIFSKKNLLKAFVEFDNLESSSKAVEALNNTVLPVYGKITVYYSSIGQVKIANPDLEHKIFPRTVDENICAKISVSTNSGSKSRPKSPLKFRNIAKDLNKENIGLFSTQKKTTVQRPLLEKGVNFKLPSLVQEKPLQDVKSTSPTILGPSNVVLISNIEGLFDTKVELFNLFSCFGNIRKLILMKNLQKALVEYLDVESATVCLKNLHCVNIKGTILKINYSKYKTIDLSKNNKNMNAINYNEVLLVPSNLNRFSGIGLTEPKGVSSTISLSLRKAEKTKPLDVYLMVEQIAKPQNIKIKNDSEKVASKDINFELTYETTEEAILVMMKLHNKQVADSKICVDFN